MSYWYILWVVTRHERQVEESVMRILSKEGIVPFILMVETLLNELVRLKKSLTLCFRGMCFLNQILNQ